MPAPYCRSGSLVLSTPVVVYDVPPSAEALVVRGGWIYAPTVNVEIAITTARHGQSPVTRIVAVKKERAWLLDMGAAGDLDVLSHMLMLGPQDTYTLELIAGASGVPYDFSGLLY